MKMVNKDVSSILCVATPVSKFHSPSQLNNIHINELLSASKQGQNGSLIIRPNVDSPFQYNTTKSILSSPHMVFFLIALLKT